MQYTQHVKFNIVCRVLPRRGGILLRLLTWLMLTSFPLVAAGQPGTSKSETPHERAVTSVFGNSNVSSVVKFTVPIKRIEKGQRRAFIEHCSAFAVGKTTDHLLFLSSWHCIDGLQGRLDSPEISYAGRTEVSEIRESGGSMSEDWLLIRASSNAFNEPITLTQLSPAPVTLGETLYGFGWGGHRKSQITAPKVLPCPVVEVGPKLTLDCAFAKGDSGGLIARKKGGAYEAVGIISAGDSTSITFAFPVANLPHQVLAQIHDQKD